MLLRTSCRTSFFCDTLYDDNYVNEDTRGRVRLLLLLRTSCSTFFGTLYDENYVNEDTRGALVMTITLMKILGGAW